MVFWVDVTCMSVIVGSEVNVFGEDIGSEGNVLGEDIGLIVDFNCCNWCVGTGKPVSGFFGFSLSLLNVIVGLAITDVDAVSALKLLHCRAGLFWCLLDISGLTRLPTFNHSPYGLPFLSSSLAVLHSFGSWPSQPHAKHQPTRHS